MEKSAEVILARKGRVKDQIEQCKESVGDDSWDVAHPQVEGCQLDLFQEQATPSHHDAPGDGGTRTGAVEVVRISEQSCHSIRFKVATQFGVQLPFWVLFWNGWCQYVGIELPAQPLITPKPNTWP